MVGNMVQNQTVKMMKHQEDLELELVFQLSKINRMELQILGKFKFQPENIKSLYKSSIKKMYSEKNCKSMKLKPKVSLKRKDQKDISNYQQLLKLLETQKSKKVLTLNKIEKDNIIQE